MNGIGGMVLGAIERHQQLVIQPPKAGSTRRVAPGSQRPPGHPIEGTRHHGIEQVAYLIVTGNRLNAQQCTGIILSLGLLQMALVIQKRRRLGEKDAKGTQGGILDAVTGVGPWFAMVRQLLSRWCKMSLRLSKPKGVVMAISSVLRGEPP